jgi:uncharacterized protein
MQAEGEDELMERTCVVTRRQNEPEAMIRFVRAPDGALTPDIRARLPGRGVWVTARADLVSEAARKQLFSRVLKSQVVIPPDLAQNVDRLLENDCLQMLAMANKAGLVVAGFGKVGAALEKGGVAALIEALNGGEDGKRKLAQMARRAALITPAAPAMITIFTSFQLDLALGRTNVIHAALASGGPTAAFLARCRRLTSYRGETTDATPGTGIAPEPDSADLQSAAGVEALNAKSMKTKQLGCEDPGSEVG